MIGGLLTVVTLAALFVLPWVATALLALATAWYEPLVPLAVGLLADTLYYVPHEGGIPLFTLSGAVVTIGALFVNGRLRTGIRKG